MDLGAVMQAVADRIDTISGLRVYAYPADNIAAPAAVVTYPETYLFDETYGRGMDRMDLRVVVLVGKVSDRATRGNVAGYVAGSGSSSVKAVVESGTYTAFDSCRVRDVEFDLVAMAGVEYLAATFTIDIAGEGSA